MRPARLMLPCMSMDQTVPHKPALTARRSDVPLRRRAAAPVHLAGWIGVALLLHLLLGGSAIVGMRLGRVMPHPEAQGAVELLMVERQGNVAATPGEKPTQPAPPPKPEATPSPRVAEAEPAPSGRPTNPADTGEPVPASAPAPAPAKPDEQQADRPEQQQPDPVAQTQQPAPPSKPPGKLTFDLDGTDSLSNAQVSGDNVIPASPDDRFRNRPPVYPRDAAMRGEHGVVVLLIHVSDYGVATGADVATSSGYLSLDQAAVEAVRKWRFRPALKDGKAVPFDMPMRFIFEAN